MNNFTNQVPLAKSIYTPHMKESYNMTNPQGLKPMIIPYTTTNQSADLQLWNGNFCPIFVFSINKYLDGC